MVFWDVLFVWMNEWMNVIEWKKWMNEIFYVLFCVECVNDDVWMNDDDVRFGVGKMCGVCWCVRCWDDDARVVGGILNCDEWIIIGRIILVRWFVVIVRVEVSVGVVVVVFYDGVFEFDVGYDVVRVVEKYVERDGEYDEFDGWYDDGWGFGVVWDVGFV